MHVEDHPLDYGGFEGTIPPGQYGAGTVIVWDRGTWEPVGDARAGYRAGKLKFRLDGEKLHGGWTLVRMHGRGDERQEPWLLIKERDDEARPAAEYSVVEAEPESVLSRQDDRRSRRDDSREGRARRAHAHAAATSESRRRRTAPSRPARPGKAKRGRARRRPRRPCPPARSKARCPRACRRSSPRSSPSRRAGDDWIYEIKFDGYRVLARIDGDDVRLLHPQRQRLDATRMPALVEAMRKLGLGSAWLDGEIVVTGGNGAPDFHALQNAFDAARTDDIHYYVFDLPYCDGHDLRSVPLVERRAVLAALLESPPSERVRFSENFDAERRPSCCRTPAGCGSRA